MKSLARRLLWVMAGVVVAAGALLAILHLPPVRGRIIDVGLSRLRSTIGLDVRAERATYNLLTLSAHLQGLTASATERPQTPFLDAEDVWQLRYGLMVKDEAAPASDGRLFGAGLIGDVQRRSLFGRAALHFSGVPRVDITPAIRRRPPLCHSGDWPPSVR